MFAATNVRIELADKVRAIGVGGIGLMHQLGERLALWPPLIAACIC